uniref:Uncharacterized protein n=1 Tax=Arundo donax TaxID=35708 RepID=A0A0A9H8B8_ARUDO
MFGSCHFGVICYFVSCNSSLVCCYESISFESCHFGYQFESYHFGYLLFRWKPIYLLS